MSKLNEVLKNLSTAYETLVYIQIAVDLAKNIDLGWHLRFCVSNELEDDAYASCPQNTYLKIA